MKKFDLEKFLTKNENEVLEFGRAENSFDKAEIEKYFSALSNEANLQGVESAYLIFGVDDKINPKTKKRNVLGANYGASGGLEKLKKEILDATKDITFSNIRERILEYLKTYGPARRSALNDLLADRLPNILNYRQKQNKIKNLLYSIQKQNLIECIQKGTKPTWKLIKGGLTPIRRQYHLELAKSRLPIF